jgi:uncharacterized membrane protein (DUF485 family)
MDSGAQHPAMDVPRWDLVARDPDFQRLVRARRRFVVAMVVFASANLALYIALVSWAPDFMASTITDGLSVGYVISIAEIVLVCALAGWYIRKAGRDWDPMLRRLVDDVRTDPAPGESSIEPGDQQR